MQLRNRRRAGLTLIEVMGLCFTLSMISAVAVPAYHRFQIASMARACTANLDTLVSAETAYKHRFERYQGGSQGPDRTWEAAYVAPVPPGGEPSGGLVGAPGAITQAFACPAGGFYLIDASDPTRCTIRCTADTAHRDATGAGDARAWTRVVANLDFDNDHPL
ncbi:MAG: type II secretion system protein [Armatimonadota bacterium]